MFLLKSIKNIFNSFNNDSTSIKQPQNWSSIATKEDIEFEIANVDLINITIFFKNNVIYDVVPDVHCYYDARYYNINGILYDTYDISSIKSILIGKSDLVSGTPVYNLEYLLRKRAIQERKLGNINLAYALLEKSINLMFNSKMEYSPTYYLKIVSWLYLDGKIEEADKTKQIILDLLPNAYDIVKSHKKTTSITECVRKFSITNDDMLQFTDIPFDWIHIKLVHNEFIPSGKNQRIFLNYISQIQTILLTCNIAQINNFRILPQDIIFNFIDGALTSYVSCTPYTKTKRIAKYPVVLHFTNTSSMYHGYIYLLKNGTIGKVSLYFNTEDTVINMLLSNDKLIVSKVYTYYGCIYDYKLVKRT